MAINENIEKTDNWFLGEDKSFPITIYQSDGSTPQDISGWSLIYVLRRAPASADPALISKTTSDGIVLTTPLSGLCTVSIADTDTEDLAEGKYYYSLKRTDAGQETILTYGYAYLRRATALA
jgi:hypothetical protein